MLKTGILNPHINFLLSRIRHTNTLVVADRGFPFWPQIETVDIALVDGIPSVLDVLKAIRTNFGIGHAFMAEDTPRFAGWHIAFQDMQIGAADPAGADFYERRFPGNLRPRHVANDRLRTGTVIGANADIFHGRLLRPFGDD